MRVTALSLLLILTVSTPPARAQLYAGSVTGVVSDPTGALIAGADAKLIDAEKGFTFTAKTDANGRYLFRAVPPGTYSLSVKANRFKEQTRTGIRPTTEPRPVSA